MQYDLTAEGVSVFTERAMQYARDSLKVYKSYRQKAREVVAELDASGISQIALQGEDETMDILRLTCSVKDVSNRHLRMSEGRSR